MCAYILEEIQKQQDDAGEHISKLLDHLMSCIMDENLMDAAKESGKQLYASMNQDDKTQKINLMVINSNKIVYSLKYIHVISCFLDVRT